MKTPTPQQVVKGMNRGTLHALWAIFSVILCVVMFTFFQKAQTLQANLETLNVELDAKQRELDNAERLSAILTQVDNLTMNESNATRLEILRYLGLDQTNYNVTIASQSQEQVGSTPLFNRQIGLNAEELSYSQALELADKFYNGRKLNLQRIEIEPNTQISNRVRITLNGKIYGLNKTPPAGQ